MNSKCVPVGTSLAVASDILEGQRWVAASIRNQNLRRHFKFLNRTFRTKDESLLQLRPDCRELLHLLLQKSAILLELHPKELAVIPALVRIAHYRCRWIRNPEDWSAPSVSAREQWQSFIAHLFQRYSVHPRWNCVWEIKGGLSFYERDWYCQLVQGVSLKSLEGIPQTISSRALHLSHSAPDYLDVRQSFRWGQLQILNTHPRLAEAILKSSIVYDFSHDAIWFRLFQKVSAAKNFDTRNFGFIADALRLTIRMHGWRKAETLMDSSLQELQNYCLKKWQSLSDREDISLNQIREPGLRDHLTSLALSFWEPMSDIPVFQTFTCGKNGWLPEAEIIELSTHSQLLEESERMHHCVASYRSKCMREVSSIFALRLTDEYGELRPTLTIEVDRRERRIVQIRGKWNRHPTYRDLNIIEQWAVQNKLTG